jgi:hypothetical protein
MRNWSVSLQKLFGGTALRGASEKRWRHIASKLALAAILHFTSHADHLQPAKLGNRKRAERMAGFDGGVGLIRRPKC